MRTPLPETPDILTPWRAALLAEFATRGMDVAVGPKRPADTVNLDGLYVRIMCLGGPWRYRALWYPRLAAESWAPTILEARRLEGIVAYATRRLEGLRIPSTPDSPGLFISSLELELSGADQSLEGAPFVLTTTQPLCISVMPNERTPSDV